MRLNSFANSAYRVGALNAKFRTTTERRAMSFKRVKARNKRKKKKRSSKNSWRHLKLKNARNVAKGLKKQNDATILRALAARNFVSNAELIS